MVPACSHISSPRRVLLFTLVIVSALAMLAPLVIGAREAGIAFAHPLAAGGMLTASPTNLTSCRHCTVTVSNQSPTRSLTWSASSQGIHGVTINPAGGTLQRKGQASVSITMPSNIFCPATDTITFSGPANSVNVSWSCPATPTPTSTPSLTPSPATPMPTATPPLATPQSPTPSVNLTPTASSPDPTPTTTSVSGSGAQQTDGNPPPTVGSHDSSVPSILLSIAALLLALCAFTLYLLSPAQASLRHRLLSLVLPVWIVNKLDQHQ